MAASKAAALPLGDRPAGNSHNDYLKTWCGRRDLNSHTLRRQNLNLVRLPIPPLPHLFLIALIKRTLRNGGYDGIRTCDPIIMSDVL